MRKLIVKIVFGLCCIFSNSLFAQNFTENALKKGWVVFLGADSSIKIRTLGLLQMQTRYLELNNGSIAPDGRLKSSTVDLTISRLCIGSSVSYRRVSFSYLLGNNGQTIVNGKLGNFYTYEAWINYQLIPTYLTLGIGQSLYRGLSRASSMSTAQLLTVEPLWLAAPTANKTDNIGRQLQILAIGNLGKLEYRTTLVRPFTSVGVNGAEFPVLNTTTPVNQSYDFPSDRFGNETYLCYQFADLENIQSSSKSFSYLGTKKIVNIGAGWAYQPRAAASRNEQGDTIFHNTLSLSLDAYLDLPLASGGVFNLYTAGYYYDYGKNYLRTLGSMNYFKGGNSPQGAGINEYIVGTGQAFYLQTAYLFAKRFTKEQNKLQIYCNFTYKNFQGLKQASYLPGAGLNYYLYDHNAKIGLQYLMRPFYNSDYKIDSYKNDILMQVQFFF